jgi:hypothetical protein
LTLTVQLEGPGAGFVELSRAALSEYAEALGNAWSAVGVGEGDRVVIYDYGSSPLVYLASRTFTSYLERGAAELTGATAVCVDGLTDNVGRLAHVVRHFEPHFLFVRAELVPLLVSGPTALPVEQRTAKLVVSADDDLPGHGERALWEERWSGGVGMIARRDSELFLAAEPETIAAVVAPAGRMNESVVAAGGPA